MSDSRIVVPMARLLIEKAKEDSEGNILGRGLSFADEEQNVDFWKLEHTPQTPILEGNVSWSMSTDEEDMPIVVGMLSVQIRNLGFDFASRILPNSIIGLELGYVSGSTIGPRLVFWGHMDDLVPATEGVDIVHTLTAMAMPWELMSVRSNLSLRDTNAQALLDRFFGMAGVRVVPDAAGIYEDLAKVAIDKWTATGPLETMIQTLFSDASAKLGYKITYRKEFGSFNLVRLIQVSKGKRTTPLEVQAVNIDLSEHMFYNASTRSSRVAAVSFLDADTDVLTDVEGLPIDKDERVRMYEYNISTPTDPRMNIGDWVFISGLPIGRAQQPALFQVMGVTHNFGETTWETSYHGPMMFEGQQDNIEIVGEA